MKRRMVAAAAMAAAVFIGSGAQAAPAVTVVDVEKVPRGADLAVAWVDGADRSIHAGAATIPTGFDLPVASFRTVSGGFLVERNDHRLFHISTAGAKTDLGAVDRYVVRTGRYAGSQFVTERQTANGYRLEVRRASDLSLVRGRTFPSYFREMDFHDGVVWVKSGKWLFNTNEFVRVDKLVRGRAEAIEARVNAFAGRADGGVLVVSPLRGTAWAPWRARAGSHVRAWSPDGRFVVLNYPHDDDGFDDLLEVRNARTGAHVARFYGTFNGAVTWEDATHFLVPASDIGVTDLGLAPVPPETVVRLGVNGSARRASSLVGPDHHDGPYVTLVSERS